MIKVNSTVTFIYKGRFYKGKCTGVTKFKNFKLYTVNSKEIAVQVLESDLKKYDKTDRITRVFTNVTQELLSRLRNYTLLYDHGVQVALCNMTDKEFNSTI